MTIAALLEHAESFGNTDRTPQIATQVLL